MRLACYLFVTTSFTAVRLAEYAKGTFLGLEYRVASQGQERDNLRGPRTTAPISPDPDWTCMFQVVQADVQPERWFNLTDPGFLGGWAFEQNSASAANAQNVYYPLAPVECEGPLWIIVHAGPMPGAGTFVPGWLTVRVELA